VTLYSRYTQINSAQEIPRDSAQLLSIVTDAKHFVDYYQYVIENAPLQVYISALVLSPSSSQVKALFEDQAPSWIKKAPLMDSDWKLHVHILSGDVDRPLSGWAIRGIGFHGFNNPDMERKHKGSSTGSERP
jgi:hypothetical protein